MKHYISPIARLILLYGEQSLLQGSGSIDIDDGEDVNESDKSNRRESIWGDF